MTSLGQLPFVTPAPPSCYLPRLCQLWTPSLNICSTLSNLLEAGGLAGDYTLVEWLVWHWDPHTELVAADHSLVGFGSEDTHLTSSSPSLSCLGSPLAYHFVIKF